MHYYGMLFFVIYPTYSKGAAPICRAAGLSNKEVLAGNAFVIQVRIPVDDERFEFVVHLLRIFLDLGERQAGTNGGHRNTVDLTVQRGLVSVKNHIVQLVYQEASYATDQQGFADGVVDSMLPKVNGTNLKHRNGVIVGINFRIRKSPNVSGHLLIITFLFVFKSLSRAKARDNLIVSKYQELPLGQQLMRTAYQDKYNQYTDGQAFQGLMYFGASVKRSLSHEDYTNLRLIELKSKVSTGFFTIIPDGMQAF